MQESVHWFLYLFCAVQFLFLFHDFVLVIPEDILRNNTLPGLMYLKQDLATLAPEYEVLLKSCHHSNFAFRGLNVINDVIDFQETASLLMKDCEDKLVNQKTTG